MRATRQQHRQKAEEQQAALDVQQQVVYYVAPGSPIEIASQDLEVWEREMENIDWRLFRSRRASRTANVLISEAVRYARQVAHTANALGPVEESGAEPHRQQEMAAQVVMLQAALRHRGPARGSQMLGRE